MSLKLIAGIFLSVLFFCWISVNAHFYEDTVYIHYVNSLLKDLDFNIINQVPVEFAKIITDNYSHPAHHSLIQTPILLLLGILDLTISSLTGSGAIQSFKLAGALLSILSLLTGYFFTRKAAAELSVRVCPYTFALFLFSTSLFYFSFFTTTCMEIFTFALSSYVLYSVVLFYVGKKNAVSLFALGTVSTMLITTKITFFPLMILSLYFLSRDFKGEWKKISIFAVSSAIVLFYTFMKDFTSFGEIVFISRAMSAFTTGHSYIDLFYTLTQGLFGKGGLFWVSPLYLPALISFFLMVKEVVMTSRAAVFYGCLSLWLLMSFFQTTFIVGPMLEDHYVGRLPIMALPLMLLGLSWSMGKLSQKIRNIVYPSLMITLTSWQVWTVSNFMAISGKGHYEYAIRKTTDSFSEPFQHMGKVLGYDTHLVNSDILRFLLFCSIATLIIYLLIRFHEQLHRYLRYYIIASSSFLLITAFVNASYSKKNGEKFILENGLQHSVTQGNHYSLYSFNYVVDMLRTEYYNSHDERLKEIIRKKHLEYLEFVRANVKNPSVELQIALEQKNLEYGYYQ